MEKARAGQGPVLVEAETYRLGAHTTADDPTKYRLREDEQHWSELDPLLRLEAHLREAHGTGDDFFADVAADAQAFADQARALVLAMDPPAFEDFFDRPYAEPHALVEEERAWYAAYQAGFADTDTDTDDDAGPGPAGPDRGTQAAGLTVAADPVAGAPDPQTAGTQEDLA